MMKKRNIICIIVFILIISICAACLIYIKQTNQYIKQKQIVKTYIDDLYDTDCVVKNASLTYNDIGFTGGLYMYYFEVYDKSSRTTYQVDYQRYDDLSEETVNHVIIQKK